MFCGEDRALRAEVYDGQICEHLLWHCITPAVVRIEDSWRAVERPKVRTLVPPHHPTLVQTDFLPLLARLTAGIQGGLSTTRQKNDFRRSYCLVRAFLGFAAELGDMPSKLEVEAEDYVKPPVTKVEDEIFFDDEELAANASREAAAADVSVEELE